MNLPFVLLLGLIIRLALGLLYHGPGIMPDTGSYFELANQLRTGDFSAYTGWRTPGYPVLLLLCGENLNFIWLAQCAMGLGTTALFYLIVESCTGSGHAAAVGALLHAMAFNHLSVEATLLSEASATFVLTLGVYLTHRAATHGWGRCTIASVALINALAALVRPISLIAGFVTASYAMLMAQGRRALVGGFFVVFFLGPILGWCAFNKATIGQFSMSTLIGLTLTNHSGAFIERAPDEYSTLRDVYLVYRAKNIVEKGTHRMTIFRARQEMKALTGYNDAELSRQLTRMSVELFAAYPVEYFRSVADAWLTFWTLPTLFVDELFVGPDVASFAQSIGTLEKWIYRLGNLLFVLLAVPILWMALVARRATDSDWNCAAHLASIVLATSVLQAFLENGGSGRYAIPTQSMGYAALIIAIWKSGAIHKRNQRPARSLA